MTRHRAGYKSTEDVRAYRARKKARIADPERFRHSNFYTAALRLKELKLRSEKIAILKHVLTPDQCDEIRKFGVGNSILEPMPINFSRPDLLGNKRLEYKFLDPCLQYPYFPAFPRPLLDLVNMLQVMCGTNVRYTRASIIKSLGRCRNQVLHADDDTFERLGSLTNRHPDRDAPYSVIIALMPNSNPTRFGIGLGRSSGGQYEHAYEQLLEQGDAIIIRGDQLHMGCAYHQVNYRLFISLGTKLFPMTGETTGALSYLPVRFVPKPLERGTVIDAVASYNTSQIPSNT